SRPEAKTTATANSLFMANPFVEMVTRSRAPSHVLTRGASSYAIAGAGRQQFAAELTDLAAMRETSRPTKDSMRTARTKPEETRSEARTGFMRGAFLRRCTGG